MSRAASLLLAALAGCGRPDPVQVPATDARLLWVGHTLSQADGARRYAWPGTLVRVRFEGTRLRASVGDAVHARSDGPDFLEIEVDGAQHRKLALRSGHRAYDLVTGLDPGLHTAVITKRTEAAVGTVTFHGFYEDEHTRLVAPPAPRSRRIEVVGDSICAGLGAEGLHRDGRYERAEEDASRSFVSIAARELDADVVIQAWSGKGLTRNSDATDRELMAALYGRVLPEDARSPAIDGGYAASALVVALGTNDFVAGAPERARFERAYRELVARLRRGRAEAPLVLVVSPMLSDTFPSRDARALSSLWIRGLADELAAQGARVRVYEPDFDERDWGHGRHPNLAAHARMGRELATTLRALLVP